ncbi:hypothetical protein Aph01nite_33060 [Acrocarpospora phusangensis]|uniref:CHAT domain-containing protein n=1 Tax=Acrocarpospora phusangensis TaxID=1070424 RepID=A0A919QBI7_9ACTN|nr:CHAT domain-containing protein [Acrocarpospora phusangensis]GIH24996.1 hypothetical protein Aph01nite_33060 [Acrocarpospora phusangensis]
MTDDLPRVNELIDRMSPRDPDRIELILHRARLLLARAAAEADFGAVTFVVRDLEDCLTMTGGRHDELVSLLARTHRFSAELLLDGTSTEFAVAALMGAAPGKTLPDAVERGISHLRRAAVLAPEDIETQLTYATMSLLTGAAADAADVTESARPMDPEDGHRLAAVRAVLDAAARTTEPGPQVLRRALEQLPVPHPGRPLVALPLARALAAVRQSATAGQTLGEALGLLTELLETPHPTREPMVLALFSMVSGNLQDKVPADFPRLIAALGPGQDPLTLATLEAARAYTENNRSHLTTAAHHLAALIDKATTTPSAYASGSTASGSTASSEAASGPAVSHDVVSALTGSGEAASGSAASDQAASGEAASGPAVSHDAVSALTGSGEAASGSAASDQAASGEAAVGDLDVEHVEMLCVAAMPLFIERYVATNALEFLDRAERCCDLLERSPRAEDEEYRSMVAAMRGLVRVHRAILTQDPDATRDAIRDLGPAVQTEAHAKLITMIEAFADALDGDLTSARLLEPPPMTHPAEGGRPGHRLDAAQHGVVHVGRGLAGDEQAMDEGIDLLRRAMTLPDNHLLSHLPVDGLLGMALMYRGWDGGRRDRDESVELLERAAARARAEPGARWAGRVLINLGRSRRRRADRRCGDQPGSVAAGLESLRVRLGDLLLQSGAERSLPMSTEAAVIAVEVASWALADGDDEAAVQALELGRGLVLHAATLVTETAELLRAAGAADLAGQWDAALASGPGTLGVDVPSSLRAQALRALRDTPGENRLLSAPGASEVAARLRTGGWDALIHLLPLSEYGTGRAVLIHQTGEVTQIAIPGLDTRPGTPIHAFTTAERALRADRDSTQARQTWEQALETVSNWAGDHVIAPLLHGLHTDHNPPRLVLIPWGPAGAVPWHAAHWNGHYACEQALISYAASARQLGTVTRRRGTTAQATRASGGAAHPLEESADRSGGVVGRPGRSSGQPGEFARVVDVSADRLEAPRDPPGASAGQTAGGEPVVIVADPAGAALPWGRWECERIRRTSYPDALRLGRWRREPGGIKGTVPASTTSSGTAPASAPFSGTAPVGAVSTDAAPASAPFSGTAPVGADSTDSGSASAPSSGTALVGAVSTDAAPASTAPARTAPSGTAVGADPASAAGSAGPAPAVVPATASAVLAALKTAPVLHYAGHGASGASSALSHLLLADGELPVRRILREATAPGSLVVLSACLTDLSDKDYDEALTLSTALIAAGAADVVGSRWTIDDDWRTGVMMTIFHHYLGETGHPAEALRLAQLWMLHGDRTLLDTLAPDVRDQPENLAALAIWAAFTHHG